jgi:Domain of unknown function (DUF4062)
MTIVNEYDILVASPGDVQIERAIAARTINELNHLLEVHGVRLRSRMWEHDAVSEFGDRPQAVLSNQIGDSCDIFVGIMWSRIGIPTGDYESGTVEEFRRAYDRMKADPNAVQMLFYFSDFPISPLTIDTHQLAAVKDFPTEVEQLGFNLLASIACPDNLT